MKIRSPFIFFVAAVLLCNCNQPKEKEQVKKAKKVIERKKPAAPVSYQLASGKEWARLHQTNVPLLRIVTAVNRADIAHIRSMDSIIIPGDTTADIAYYMPFPLSVAALNDIDKIIFFSYSTQSFAAYENGEMIYTGATNMGRKNDPTPEGLFFTNWKAEKTTSTFNDEWELKWNFNIANKLGVGWHEYEMPGYPASHSCMRLMEADAKYLYTWADQWVLNKNEEVQINGTPVVIFGSYDFNAPKPWKKLLIDPHALDISEQEIATTVAPYLQQVMATQVKRTAHK